MTYGELKNSALQLINQYSIAGVEIPPSYNNQADYVARIPALVNAALTYISTSTRFIPATVVFDADEGTRMGAYIRHVLPEDYWQIRGAGLLDLGNYYHSRWTAYRMMPPDHILIEAHAPKHLMMEYFRKPQLLPEKPVDEQMIDGDPEVQRAVVFYVAAHLVMYDDHFEYASLKNEFENIMDRMAARPNDVEIHTVEDVYGFGGDW